jgi:hypothetical protein
MRLPDDHRYGRGYIEDRNAYRLTCHRTGKRSALNVFWHEYELLDLLDKTLGMKPGQMTRLRFAYENSQNGWIIRNCDLRAIAMIYMSLVVFCNLFYL